MMANEEEILRRLLVELRILEGTAETIQTRLGLVETAMTELQVANATLTGLKEKSKGDSLLVPVGGGSYIKAKLEDSEKVIVGIGAGVAKEKTFDEARESVENQMTELENLRNTLQQQLSQTAARINDARDKIQAMTEKKSKGERRVRKT